MEKYEADTSKLQGVDKDIIAPAVKLRISKMW
jgi:hypothetical protein